MSLCSVCITKSCSCRRISVGIAREEEEDATLHAQPVSFRLVRVRMSCKRLQDPVVSQSLARNELKPSKACPFFLDDPLPLTAHLLLALLACAAIQSLETAYSVHRACCRNATSLPHAVRPSPIFISTHTQLPPLRLPHPPRDPPETMDAPHDVFEDTGMLDDPADDDYAPPGGSRSSASPKSRARKSKQGSPTTPSKGKGRERRKSEDHVPQPKRDVPFPLFDLPGEMCMRFFRMDARRFTDFRIIRQYRCHPVLAHAPRPRPPPSRRDLPLPPLGLLHPSSVRQRLRLVQLAHLEGAHKRTQL